MPEINDFLRNLTLVLGVAALTTVLFQRLHQPVVLGYVLAGLIIGPHVPIPLVADPATVHTLSELGVILLMFSLGLEFSLRKLIAGGWRLIIIAGLQCSVMMWLGYVAGRLLGWDVLGSLFAGAAIAISSTTIIVKAFAERGVRGGFTDLVFGVLIVEDLIAIVLLALLTPAATGRGVSGPELAVTIVRLVAFLTVLMGAGMLVVPRAMRYVVGLRRRETTLVVSIGLCFGTALLAGMIGYSVALGAFLAGSLVAESGAEQLVERLVEPVRDMFAAVFFVSVGMMIDPRLVIAHWQAVLLFTVLVIVGKIVAVSVSAFFTGTGVRTAVQAGMSLAQIGEFSFIIAGVGLAAGGASSTLYTIMVAVSAITTLTTPWLIRQAGPTADAIDRNLPRPLQTLVALYGSWIESTRRRPETSAERARTQRLLRGMGIDAAVVGALCVGASIAAAPLGARVAAATGLRPDQGRAILVAVAVLLSLPFLIGIFRLGRALGNDVARRAFSDPEPGRLDLAAAPRRSLVITIQVAAILVVGAALVAVTQPFLPPVAGIALVAGMLILLGILVWRSAADLQGHVRAAAVGIVEVLGRQSRDPAAPDAERALERAYQLLPGLGEPFPVRILDHYPVVGRTLSELRLRSRTAATIVVISRGEHVVLMPDGHETLHAGDVVALAGTRPAIEAAKQLLLDGRES